MQGTHCIRASDKRSERGHEDEGLCILPGDGAFRGKRWKALTLADLNRLRVLQGEIRRLDEKAQELRARAERLTSMLSGMPAGAREHDQLAGIVADLLDMPAALQTVPIYGMAKQIIP